MLSKSTKGEDIYTFYQTQPPFYGFHMYKCLKNYGVTIEWNTKAAVSL